MELLEDPHLIVDLPVLRLRIDAEGLGIRNPLSKSGALGQPAGLASMSQTEEAELLQRLPRQQCLEKQVTVLGESLSKSCSIGEYLARIDSLHDGVQFRCLPIPRSTTR